MTFREQERRYLDDVEFHCLVDYMYHLLMGGEFSICELRVAAVFAANKFAMENTRTEWRIDG